MAKRNVWEYEETQMLLSIMQEIEALKHFDGKLYRNLEIFRKIEREMFKRGFTSKDAKQIETRWKNLKKNYIATKKKNNKSGHNRELCAHYDELDRMLGSRPSVNTLDSGIDTSRVTLSGDDIDLNKETDHEVDFEEDDPSSSQNSSVALDQTGGSSAKKKKSDSTSRGSYARNLEKLSNTLKVNQKAMNEEFFNKQKELIEYEHLLFSQKEEELMEKSNAATKELLDDSTNKFLVGLQVLFNGSGTFNSEDYKDFFERFVIEEKPEDI